MGIHILGAHNVTLADSALIGNGNGNGYFHNAYFLRVVGSVVRNCTLIGSSGHGLKLTVQNNTLVENCTISDNEWQGIWVGGEAGQPANTNLRIVRTIIERNRMNGVQLGGTQGFEVHDSLIRHNPTANKGGLAVLGSSDGLISNSTITANSINLIFKNAKRVVLAGVSGCDEALYYGFCADSTSASSLRQHPPHITAGRCTAVPIGECVLPDTPW
eukprot:g2479.t1